MGGNSITAPPNFFSDSVDEQTAKTFFTDLVKLFKHALLITPSSTNGEIGFSVLTLLRTKQQNWLSLKTIDCVMRLVLLGPNKF